MEFQLSRNDAQVLFPMSSKDLPIDLSLTWGEVKWGLEKGIIGWRVPVELAEAWLLNGYDRPYLVDLASVGKDEAGSVGELVDSLSLHEGLLSRRSPGEIWVYLVLRHLFVHRDRLVDPLGAIEEVYAHFDYPESMATLVRFVPLSAAEIPGVPGIIRRWKEYVSISPESNGPSFTVTRRTAD